MRNEMGYYFEDYIEGDLIVHSKSKTIFESDNNLFSLLLFIIIITSQESATRQVPK